MSNVLPSQAAAKTYFAVLHSQALVNLGYKACCDDIDWTATDDIGDFILARLHAAGLDGCGTLCTSAKGVDHCHLVLTSPKAMRPSAVAKLIGKAHVELMQGTRAQALAYIQKLPPYTEKGEKVNSVFGSTDCIEDNSGNRSDLKDFDKLALMPDFDLRAYALAHAHSVSRIRYFEERYCALKAANLPRIRDVKVIYVQGPTGSGKTYPVYDTKGPLPFRVSCDAKTSFPFDGYFCEDTLLLDELRPGIFSPADLLQILDKYPYRVNVKGSSRPACWNTVYITTAFPLSKWFQSERGSCDDLRAQFLRRISECYVAVHDDAGYYWKPVAKDILSSESVSWQDIENANIPRRA